ncbi:MAG: DinB family protein [Actinomadura sp.]
MSWTAPEITRGHAEPLVGDERTMLEGWLEWQRTTLLRKCAGLTGEQLARRAVPPSDLSLLGLVRHMAKAERLWFRQRVGGAELPRLHPAGEADIHAAKAAGAEADYATLLSEWEACRAVAARASLDDEFTMESWGPRRVSVRWVYIHMIEEYARHNGHADLLRERIDGVTGF